MKYLLLLIALILTPSVSSTAQTAHQSLRKGDADYAKNDFKKSEENYRRALDAEKSSKAAYNLGNAIYGQKRYDEAIQQYDDVAKKTNDNQLKFNSLYNKGNAHFWKKEYPQAIDAYKKALRMNPNDEDAKKNLALAQRMQKKEEEQKKKDEQNKDNKDKKDDKNKNDKDKNSNEKDQNKDKKDDKKDEDDKKPQDKNNQPTPPDQNPKQTPQEQAQQDLKKEEAKRMLQIMDDEERKVQQRLKKGAPRPSRSTKDW